jgi:hypothetical protein
MRHYQKAIGFYGGLILENAILRDTHAIERSTKRTQATHDDGILDGPKHDRRKISKYDDMPDNRNSHEQSAEEQSPKTAPECAIGAPELDPISRAVKADLPFLRSYIPCPRR